MNFRPRAFGGVKRSTPLIYSETQNGRRSKRVSKENQSVTTMLVFDAERHRC